jgi:hypothetical protein
MNGQHSDREFPVFSQKLPSEQEKQVAAGIFSCKMRSSFLYIYVISFGEFYYARERFDL